jgi:hypothetical protein
MYLYLKHFDQKKGNRRTMSITLIRIMLFFLIYARTYLTEQIKFNSTTLINTTLKDDNGLLFLNIPMNNYSIKFS